MGNRPADPKMLQDDPSILLQITHELLVTNPQPHLNKKLQINARKHANPLRFPRSGPIQHKLASKRKAKNIPKFRNLHK